MGIGFLPLRVKRPGRVADHSPPSIAKVRNEWRYTSVPPVYLPGVGRGSSVFLFNGLATDKQFILQGGSNMTGTYLCVNKPHCAAAMRP